MEKSGKNFVAAILLCFFLGCLGVHRFYVGKIGTGILQLITMGGLGVWVLIDFIMIVIGKFKDKDGLYLTAGAEPTTVQGTSDMSTPDMTAEPSPTPTTG
jgi:TM2 domain-containing membrane protein YozV